jgi:hypothetical protein
MRQRRSFFEDGPGFGIGMFIAVLLGLIVTSVVLWAIVRLVLHFT